MLAEEMVAVNGVGNVIVLRLIERERNDEIERFTIGFLKQNYSFFMKDQKVSGNGASMLNTGLDYASELELSHGDLLHIKKLVSPFVSIDRLIEIEKAVENARIVKKNDNQL